MLSDGWWPLPPVLPAGVQRYQIANLGRNILSIIFTIE
jgi:hypothetical protein